MMSIATKLRPLIRKVAGAGLLLAVSLAGHASQEASYPDRAVKVIVPYGAGGAADILARTVAAQLSTMWGQPVVVENRVGGVGNVGILAAVRSEPDGYTLVSIPVSNLAVNPHLYRKLPYDIRRDLTPVVQVGAVQNVIVTGSEGGAASLAELITRGRQDKALTYASPGVGSQAHVGAEMFARAAGIKVLHVPYNGVAAGLTDVMGGRIDFMVAQLPAALPGLHSGRLKAHAVLDEARSSFLPQLPTLREAAGISVGSAVSWSAIFAPVGVSDALRQKIAAEVTRALQAPEVREKLRAAMTEPRGGSPDDLVKAWKADFDRYGEIIRELRISLD